MIALIALLAWAAQEPAPALSGPATLELCLNEAGAGQHPDCRAILQPEAALVPDALFNTAIETPPARRDGWLGVICGPDRLAAGQTAEMCREDAQARLERARLARLALAGRTPSGFTEDPEDRWGTGGESAFDIALAEAQREHAEASTTVTRGPAAQPQRERCQRREDVRRDPDTGDSSASYSFNCSWGDGDPEQEARARELMESLLGGD